jgi:hypothetical protein
MRCENGWDGSSGAGELAKLPARGAIKMVGAGALSYQFLSSRGPDQSRARSVRAGPISPARLALALAPHLRPPSGEERSPTPHTAISTSPVLSSPLADGVRCRGVRAGEQ